MMKTKCVVMSLVALVSMAIWADAANLLLSFSTTGPDLYADGKTTVKDGEWYALCWTANATFGGITTGLEPVVAGDRVLLAAPLAHEGHCPSIVFQVDSKDIPPAGGAYFVYLLDTRDAAGNPSVAVITGGKRVPAMVNGSLATIAYTTASSSSGVGTTATRASVADGNWAESAVDTTTADFTQAKISAIRVVGDKVQITVSGMMPGVKYNVRAGEAVDKLDTFALEAPAVKQGEATEFILDKDKGKFFKVIRQPLEK